MEEQEISDQMDWNFVVGTYVRVKNKIKEPLGSVEFLEAMMKEAKLMELILSENFSEKSLNTKVKIIYEFS